MEAFFEAFSALAQTKSVWIYVIIFFGKFTEVTTSTLRIVLINRGIRSLGCLLSVFEIILWLVITSTVLTGFQSDPLKIIFYAAAYACGNFMGSWLDEKLAFGLSSVQIVVKDIDTAHNLTQVMREAGYGITTMDVHGIDDEQRYMMVTMIRRKQVAPVMGIINRVAENALITVSDVKVQKGGYYRNSATRPHPSLPFRKKVAAAWGKKPEPPLPAADTKADDQREFTDAE
ncbi:DUF5698 domain-containing protein [Christensenellaceae bacterium OttesenSCG-928-M15]|nr:DUF5698 domain-containing protein [Christensenellaceae bacterium OttesenSCG-928-M15]